jgi:signal transduction histidine kinase
VGDKPGKPVNTEQHSLGRLSPPSELDASQTGSQSRSSTTGRLTDPAMAPTGQHGRPRPEGHQRPALPPSHAPSAVTARPRVSMPGGDQTLRDEIAALEKAVIAEREARRGAEEARDKAVKAAAGREAILEIVAHDLRNPLNLVKVGTGMLARTTRKAQDGEPIEVDRVMELVGSFQIAVRRMERLISDLLDLGSMDQNELRLVRGPTEANKLVDEVMIEMQAMADERGVELRAEKPGKNLVIDCDRDRVVQVLENLIANAIKFTPRGKHVTVRLVEAGPEARFEVADEGPGIPDDVLPHIFDTFYRAKESKGRGLGLGLSIALGLVRAHRGAIWAESERERGATFVFTMPKREARSDTVELPVVRVAKPIPKR